MYSRLFNFSKKFIPKISQTERTALLAGSVSIERDLISGTPNLKEYISKYSYQKLQIPIKLNSELNNFCSRIDDIKIMENKKIPQDIFNLIKDYKLFGLNIQKKYGGLELDPHTRCKIVEKITTASGSIGSMVMVPNSLGPAELLHKYGTIQQKERYLNGLATSEYIPCFGLTGLYNGSDAVNMQCSGNVVNIDEKLFLNITFSKRYITLAPIANLIGLAVKISDPKNYLEKNLASDSITVLLLEKDKYKDIKIGYKHDPLGAQFPNGTITGDNILVSIDDVIGGKDMIGKGWLMLMECLAEGRGISLPASAYASSSSIVKFVSEYCNVREQFKTPIGKMEGIREKTAEIFCNTFIMYSMQNLFNSILSQKISSSVLSAIMKRELTEYGRINMNHAMDIVGGWGIIKNKNNILANAYQLTPIPITVEGSNILTRSLIIYGQGLIKSHKNIYGIIQSCENDNLQDFKKSINELSVDLIKILSKLFIRKNNNQLKTDDLSRKYALLSYLCLLNYGPKLKTKEYVSGRMADILSDLYKSYSVMWLCNNLEENKKVDGKTLKLLEDYCLNILHGKIIDNFNLVLNDIKSPTKYLLMGLFRNTKKINSDNNTTVISNLFLTDNELKRILTENVFVPSDVDDIRHKLLNHKNDKNIIESILKVN
jgi:acyl-CoA dehydrogenase